MLETLESFRSEQIIHLGILSLLLTVACRGHCGAQKHCITSKAKMQWAKKFGVENAADKARIVEVRQRMFCSPLQSRSPALEGFVFKPACEATRGSCRSFLQGNLTK